MDLFLDRALLEELILRYPNRRLRDALLELLTDELEAFRSSRDRQTDKPWSRREHQRTVVDLPHGQTLILLPRYPLLRSGTVTMNTTVAEVARIVLGSTSCRIWRAVQIIRAAKKYCLYHATLDGLGNPEAVMAQHEKKGPYR